MPAWENAMHRFTNWREQLAGAPDASALTDILRRYVESLGPLANALPAQCREALAEEFDVQAAAVTLLQEELRFRGPDDVRALLQEVAHTFASASVRLAVIHEMRPPIRSARASGHA